MSTTEQKALPKGDIVFFDGRGDAVEGYSATAVRGIVDSLSAENKELRAQVEAMTKPDVTYLRNWSMLAARALDDCHSVIEEIEAESTAEKDSLNELRNRVSDLFRQALSLHGLLTRSQLNNRMQFGKLADLDATPSPLTRPAVPEFTGIAQRKLDSLLADGFQVTGYAIQRDSTRGFIESAGFVGWWTRTGVPDLDNVDWPDVEDMAHGALQEALSFGLDHNVISRFGQSVMKKTRAALLAAAPQPEVQAQFQQRVQPWLMECFGAMIAGDREERNHRFLEEALELVQACGCTASEAHQLVDYTFGRPIGEPAQEVGGVMVTLAALCLANDLDMHAHGETELARISQPEMVAKIRAKQAAKPKYSPLPEAAPQPSQQEAVLPSPPNNRYCKANMCVASDKVHEPECTRGITQPTEAVQKGGE